MILVNSGAFLSISSWFCELTELIFVMIPYISSTGYPPKTQGIMGHVQVANGAFFVFLAGILAGALTFLALYYWIIAVGCQSSIDGAQNR